jgi:predicted dehydrogenase
MAGHPPLKFAAIGLDHRHIYHQVGRLLNLGAECKGYYTRDSAVPLEGFGKRFPDLPRVSDVRALLEDPEIQLIVTAAIPYERAEVALEAMRHGKDVMVDKPGVITEAQLADIVQLQQETGRIWSVDFSERFEVRAMTRATELVAGGAIGRVVQTVGFGPHRLNRDLRPDWFFKPAAAGGILADIGSHQIDQFLHFTGSTDVEIAHAWVENTTRPEHPGFQDYGEVTLRGDRGHGFVRVDWFTPDGLPTWGDGRLFLLGTAGTIEVRKYIDVGREHVPDQLFLVNSEEHRVIDCRDAPLPYFDQLLADVRDRTETAVPQAHTFRTMEVALRAQAMAEGSQ